MLLSVSRLLIAQAPIYQIQGPHTEFEGPYHIRVFVNYVQDPNDQWTQGVDLPARTAGILAKLNSSFNPYQIYFIGQTEPCPAPFQVITTTSSMFFPSNLHADALDIFDVGGTGMAEGHAVLGIPNNFLQVSGTYPGLPAGHSEVIVHEVGHCLGLSHIFTGPGQGGCLETGGVCTPGGEPDCYCCGDYVCDTPISPKDITVSADCSSSVNPVGLPPEVFRNVMSYSVPPTCRDIFTEGQVQRMWAYLALAPLLQNMQVQPLSYPAATPASVSGNIVVASGELVISTPMQMLPGATILVKKGAKLRVESSITGACGQMWEGIQVEGDAFDPDQDPAEQGWVVVESTGLIEHARCAIDVRGTDPGSGGGIVTLRTNSQLKDNTIGVRFEQYAFQNRSTFSGPIFSVTDNYRGGAKRPTFLELDAIKGLKITLGRFWDLRTQCPGPTSRAIGIDSKNAGFRASTFCFFKNLYIGIKADKLTDSNGSLSVLNSFFQGCYKGAELTMSSSFSIFNNQFRVRKPDFCPSLPVEVKGVEIGGTTTGFTFQENSFVYDGPVMQPEILIGTDCEALGDGLNSTIFKNDYMEMTVGNRAAGMNGSDVDGLLYLCNTNHNYAPGPDFLITTSGSIRKIQGQENPLTQVPLPTGNTFSGDPSFFCTIENQGTEIDYYFYELDSSQDPGMPGGSPDTTVCIVGGFNRKEVNQPDSCSATAPPCFPCPPTEVEEWKSDFYQNRGQWLDKLDGLPGITDSAEYAAELDAIRRLRLAMNEDGSRVLMQYNLDTLGIEVDSIVHWLGLIGTYATDLRLASHYFYTGAFGAFDTLWSQIPNKYALQESQEDEFDKLGEVYAALRLHLQSGGSLGNLPESIISPLKIWAADCDAPGFLSAAILWRNGIEQRPDCSGEQSRPTETTATAPFKKAENLKIYPNPADDLLLVELPAETQNGWLRIYNLHGSLQKEMALPDSNSQLAIPVQDLRAGLYLIHWFYNDISGQAKIVISH